MKSLLVAGCLLASSLARAGTVEVHGYDRNQLAAEGADVNFVARLTQTAGEGAVFTFRSSNGPLGVYVAAPGLCSTNNGVVTCSAPYAMTGESVYLQAFATPRGPVTLTATVTSAAGTTTTTAVETVVPAAGARVEMAFDHDHVTRGEPVVLTQSVTCDGPAPCDTLLVDRMTSWSSDDDYEDVFEDVEILDATGWTCFDDVFLLPACMVEQLGVGETVTLVWRSVPQATVFMSATLRTESTTTQNPVAFPSTETHVFVEDPTDPTDPTDPSQPDPGGAGSDPDPGSPPDSDPDDPDADDSLEPGGCATSTPSSFALLVIAGFLLCRRRN